MADEPRRRRVAWGEVVIAAAEIVKSEGAADLTPSALADRLGTDRADVTYWFDSPGELLGAVMKVRQERFLDEVWSSLANETTNAAKLHRLLEICAFDYNATYWIELWRLGLRDDESRRVRQQLTDGYREMATRVLRAGVVAGEFEDVPIDAVALIIVNLVASLSVQATLEDPAVDREQMLECCVDALQALVGAELRA